MYPTDFPLTELGEIVAYLRGPLAAPDIPRLAHAVWVTLGYALGKTLGDAAAPRPVFAAAPIQAEVARLGASPQALADELEALAVRHRTPAAAARGKAAPLPAPAPAPAAALPSWLVPMLVKLMERLLLGV